jgi:L-lysine 6-transaminase
VTQLDHDPIVTKDFRGFVAGNIQVPFPAVDTSQNQQWNERRLQHSLTIIEDSLKRYHNEIVAIILEPIQGAGGHRLALPQFYQRLSTLAHEFDIFLGVDEVQTAGGQTGTMFAIDQFDLPYPPQAVATAKKFANGVIYMLETVGDLGVLDSTWGGSLADMVRFVQEMKIVRRERLIEQVGDKARRMVEGLNALAEKYNHLIFNVRGLGLYQGFTMRNPANRDRLKQIALQKEQLLLLGAGTQSIRFRPVLDVTVEDIDLMRHKLNRSLAELSN